MRQRAIGSLARRKVCAIASDAAGAKVCAFFFKLLVKCFLEVQRQDNNKKKSMERTADDDSTERHRQ